MREIKFRAYYQRSDDTWIKLPEGEYTLKELTDRHIHFDQERIEWVEYTGLEDKNGVEIYEGDILSFGDTITADNSLGFDPNGFTFSKGDYFKVIWSNKFARFECEIDEEDNWKLGRDTWQMMVDGECEVIGNIYENSELL